MATEILAVPEELLAEVVATIRQGTLCRNNRQRPAGEFLMQWVEEEEEYLARMAED